jgi:hypothetical protein
MIALPISAPSANASPCTALASSLSPSGSQTGHHSTSSSGTIDGHCLLRSGMEMWILGAGERRQGHYGRGIQIAESSDILWVDIMYRSPLSVSLLHCLHTVAHLSGRLISMWISSVLQFSRATAISQFQSGYFLGSGLHCTQRIKRLLLTTTASGW